MEKGKIPFPMFYLGSARMFLEGSTYSVKSRSFMISKHSAVTLKNLIFPDNRLPRGTWIKCFLFSFSQICLFREFRQSRFLFPSAEGSISKRPAAVPPMRKVLLLPNAAAWEAHLGLQAFQTDDVLVGWWVFLPKIFSEGVDLHGELSLNFWCLQAEKTFRADSEVVQWTSVQILSFISQESLCNALFYKENMMRCWPPTVPHPFVLVCPNKTRPYPCFYLEWLSRSKTTLLIRGKPSKQ